MLTLVPVLGSIRISRRKEPFPWLKPGLFLGALAVTSTNGWIRRLGYRRWVRLHSLVYVAGALAALHFIWRVKIDVSQPLTYAAILGALLAVRAAFWLRGRYPRRAA